MVNLIPLNDYVLVQLIEPYADTKLTSAGKDEFASIQKGVCIEVGEALYRSRGNWVLDEVQQAAIFTSSELRQAFINELGKAKKMLIGKVVYWEQYADKDTTFEVEPGVKVALIKLAQICAMEQEADAPDKVGTATATATPPIKPNNKAEATPQVEVAPPAKDKNNAQTQ